MYGATETAPIATTFRNEERCLDSPRARSCGQPAVGVEIRILGTDGVVVPAGEVGEVVIRGDNVMVGYWNKPEQTAAALVDGWYHSGDLGYLDDEGYVYLVDRAKDMIVSGGENVYSAEVEDVLYRHPAVLEAAVFGVPDAQWGEAVYAVVIPRSDVDRARAHRALPRCRSRATRCRSRSSCAPSRCRSQARARCSSASCASRTGPAPSRGSAVRDDDEGRGTRPRPSTRS